MKTILISGGSDGLGKAVALKLSKKYNVVILANDPDKIEQAAKEIGCDFKVADVTDYSSINNAVSEVIKKYKAIDYLINSAGLWIEGLLETNEPEKIRKVMDVNATGTIFLTHAVLPYMKKEKSGRIINIISQAGLEAKTERSVYMSSKWAITGFTKALAVELAGSGITVTGFYPGRMKTKLFAKAGIEKDMTNFLELVDVVRAVEFIVETPDELTIPEFGIKSA